MAKNQAMADAFQRLGNFTKHSVTDKKIFLLYLLTTVRFKFEFILYLYVNRNQTESESFILGFCREEPVCNGDGRNCVFHLHCSPAV